MSKYKPLERHLRASGKSRLALTFSQIEKIVGSRLPASARRYPAWWSNNEGSHVQAQAWKDPGYRTEQVDIAEEKVTFVADSSPLPELSPGGGKAERASAALFGSMKGTTIVMPGVDLTQPTAPEWGERSAE